MANPYEIATREHHNWNGGYAAGVEVYLNDNKRAKDKDLYFYNRAYANGFDQAKEDIKENKRA